MEGSPGVELPGAGLRGLDLGRGGNLFLLMKSLRVNSVVLFGGVTQGAARGKVVRGSWGEFKQPP